MKHYFSILLTGLILAWHTGSPAAEWSRFRGPNGSGVSDAQRLPEKLDADANVSWKVSVAAGLSSPIVSDGRLFITSHVDDYRREASIMPHPSPPMPSYT